MEAGTLRSAVLESLNADLTLTDRDDRGFSTRVLRVRGAIEGATIEAPGSIRTLVTNLLRDSDVLVSTNGTVPESAGDFADDAEIRRLRVRGSGEGLGFAESRVAAPRIGVANLDGVQTDAQGAGPFGVFLREGENNLRLVRFRDADGAPEAVRGPSLPIAADHSANTEDDFVVRVLGDGRGGGTG